MSIKAILRRFTARALAQAQALGFSVSERDLQYFVQTVNRNRAVTMRRLNKDETVFLVYQQNERRYVVYNNTYKSITGFMSEQDARYNKHDEVRVMTGEKSIPGKILYILPPYGDPRDPNILQRFRARKFDVTPVEQASPDLRPQYSYLVGVYEGGQKKVVWPSVSSLRKVVSHVEGESGGTASGGHGAGRGQSGPASTGTGQAGNPLAPVRRESEIS